MQFQINEKYEHGSVEYNVCELIELKYILFLIKWSEFLNDL